MNYALAQFVRTSGIGNKLFPYARAYLHAKRENATLLRPDWEAIRRGPLFRRGSLSGGLDLSSIPGKVWLYGNFNKLNPPISKLRLFRNELRKLSGDRVCSEQGMNLALFAGDGDHFRSLVGHHQELAQELHRISSPAVQKAISSVPICPIVINVRLGRDFKQPSHAAKYLTTGAIQTPLSWYIHALEIIRKRTEQHLPALVVSDGRDEELVPLLRLPNVKRFTSRLALADLLVMQQSQFIIATGGSSFSAWAAFLAQAETMTITGQNMSWFGLDQANKSPVTTIDLLS